MKSDGEIMEILAAYDLTRSLRATAELTGCSHHTVAKHVQARDAGRPIGERLFPFETAHHRLIKRSIG